MDEKMNRWDGNGDEAPAAKRLYERGKEIRSEIETLIGILEEGFTDLEKTLQEQLSRSPYPTLAAAAGVGYVLGGGVPSPATRILLDFGTRFAVAALVQGLVAPASRESGARRSS
jgi:hypothetical protein